jgi:hypothetical protein
MVKFVDWSRYVLIEINQIVGSVTETLAAVFRFWPDP